MKTVLLALILSATAFAQLPGIGGGGGGGGGGGAGCVPAGSSGQVLSDDGAGACTSNSTAAGLLTFMGTPSSANLAALLTNETGTSLAVFNTSPLLVTPKVTAITDANGNPFVISSATASAVDSLTITNAATANPATVQIAATGSDTNINLSLIGKGTGGVNFPNGFTNGSSPPSLTAGTGGADAYGEGTVPSVGAASGVCVQYADSTAHALLVSCNNGSYYPVGRIVAFGAKALDFASTATGACATVITDTATGAASTDTILFNANASIKAVTGYVPAATGGFSIAAFPTSNTVNFEGCNWTSGTVDPGSITVNWMVIRK